MTFRQRRNYGIPMARQGYLYFYCLRYDDLSQAQRDGIVAHCRAVTGGDDAMTRALLDTLTHPYPMQRSANKFYMDLSCLSRLVKRFYQTWDFGSMSA